MSPLPERLADHWWWRPGCRPGRKQYVWHILLGDQPVVRAAVRLLQEQFGGISGLDLVPEPWLHMTTHIAGFTDEISDAEANDIADAASHILQDVAPVPVTFGPILFHPEAVMLAARPIPALAPIHEAVCRSAVEVLGPARASHDDNWIPHVTAAYSNADRAARPVIEAAGKVAAAVMCEGVIGRVHLVAQERVDHAYRWEQVATVSLCGGSSG